MKLLFSVMLISAMAVLYANQAHAEDRRVSLSYDLSLTLSVSTQSANATEIYKIYHLPSVTPAWLINNDYSLKLPRSARYTLDPSSAEPYSKVKESGWRLFNVDNRTVYVEPVFFWSSGELGVRANAWNADRYCIFTYKTRY